MYFDLPVRATFDTVKYLGFLSLDRALEVKVS
jgi:hypothetical protein